MSRKDLEKLVIGGIAAGGVCVLLVVLAANGVLAMPLAVAICIGVGVVFLAFWARLYARPRLSERSPIRPLVRRNHATTLSAPVTHVQGLPFAEGERVTMYYEPGRIVFRRSGKEVVLSRGFIDRIERTTQRDVGLGEEASELLAICCTRLGRTWRVLVDASDAGSFGARVERDFASPPSHMEAGTLLY